MKLRAPENGFRISTTERALYFRLFTAIIVTTLALKNLPIWVSSLEQQQQQQRRQQSERANIDNATVGGSRLEGSGSFFASAASSSPSSSQESLQRGKRTAAASAADNSQLSAAEPEAQSGAAPNFGSKLAPDSTEEANLENSFGADGSPGAGLAGWAGLGAGNIDAGDSEAAELMVGGGGTVYRELASFEEALMSESGEGRLDAIYFPSSDELAAPALVSHAVATGSVAGSVQWKGPGAGQTSTSASAATSAVLAAPAAAGTDPDEPGAAPATKPSSFQEAPALAPSTVKDGTSDNARQPARRPQPSQTSKSAAEATGAAPLTSPMTSKSTTSTTTASTPTASTITTTGALLTPAQAPSDAAGAANDITINNNSADEDDFGDAGVSLAAATAGINLNQHARPCLGKRNTDGTFKWDCIGLQLIKVPVDLNPKPMILRFGNTGIESVRRHSLQNYRDTLRDFLVEMAPNLLIIEEGSFRNLIKLRVVYIFQAPKLVSFDLAASGLLPELRVIRIQRTGLERWPKTFKQDRILFSVNLDKNNITSLDSQPVNIRTDTLNLEFNYIKSIDEFTFNGSEIATLLLGGNRQLSFIHPNAFANLTNLITLDLSNTSVVQLPSIGFSQLRNLYIRNSPALKRIPSIYTFPMLEKAHLTYAYHCCSFRYPKTHDPSAYEEHLRNQKEALCPNRRDEVALASAEAGQVQPPSSDFEGIFDIEQKMPAAPGVKVGVGSSPAQQQNTPVSSSSHLKAPAQGGRLLIGNGLGGRPQADQASQQAFATPTPTPTPTSTSTSTSTSTPTPTPTTTGTSSNRSQPAIDPSSKKLFPNMHTIECGEMVINEIGRNIICTPEPTAFEPCEDIMGYSMLRVAVWFVVGASVFGNLSVIVVLMGVFRRLSVPKFLQLNLAIGDLFMGVYLAMLAFADLTTVGVYFNYAIEWQHGYGCKIAGAASLFASQLSIFTLSVITFERYYTITYSIDLNMRLQLGWAARIMFLGWIYAFASAMLPIFADINSYTMTSICLPIRTTYLVDRIFIVILLSIDASAFVIILACYLKMYLLIVRQKTEATAKERTVAMRMALLVSTDFACWAPIIFFGTTAFFGQPLISLTNSKILIVFFYPLNSMANPFLYVISTRQYKRDLNYLTSRWQMWRKNLFKKSNESFYSNNAAYGAAQYPPGNLTAHLGAVAAVTGVANHLRHNHIGVPINIAGNYSGGGGGGGDGGGGVVGAHSHQCHHYHHHQHGADGDGCALNAIKLHEQRIVCTKSHQGQYIIRHQILTDKHLASAIGRGDTYGQRSARSRLSRPTTQVIANCVTYGRESSLSLQQQSSQQAQAATIRAHADPEEAVAAMALMAAATSPKQQQMSCVSSSTCNNLTVITAATGANNIISSTQLLNLSDAASVASGGGQACDRRHHRVLEGSPALLLVGAVSDESTSEARNADENNSMPMDDNDASKELICANNCGGSPIEAGGTTAVCLHRRAATHTHGHARKRYSICCTTTTPTEGRASVQVSGDSLQSEGQLDGHCDARRNKTMIRLKQSSKQQSLSTGTTASPRSATTTPTKKRSQAKRAPLTTCRNCGSKCCGSCFSPVIGASRNSLSPYFRSQSSGAAQSRRDRKSRVCPAGKTATTGLSDTSLAALTGSQLVDCSAPTNQRSCSAAASLPNGSNQKRAASALKALTGRRRRCLCSSGDSNLIILKQLSGNDDGAMLRQTAQASEAAGASNGAAGGGQRKAIDILGNLSCNEPTSSVSGISTSPPIEPPQEAPSAKNCDDHLAVSLGCDAEMIELIELAQQQQKQCENRANRKHSHHQHHHRAHRCRACRRESRCSQQTADSLSQSTTAVRRNSGSNSLDKAAAAAATAAAEKGLASSNQAISSEMLSTEAAAEREASDEQQASSFADSNRCHHNHQHESHRHRQHHDHYHDRHHHHRRRRHQHCHEHQEHELPREHREQRRSCLRRRKLLERTCEVRGWSSSQEASRKSSQSQVEVCEQQTLELARVDDVCEVSAKEDEQGDEESSSGPTAQESIRRLAEAAHEVTVISRSRVTITPQASVISESCQPKQQQAGQRKELESILKQSPTKQQQPKTNSGRRLLGLFKGSSFQTCDGSDAGGSNKCQRGSQRARQKRVSIMASHHSG